MSKLFIFFSTFNKVNNFMFAAAGGRRIAIKNTLKQIEPR
jgi:hypothetical protein